MGTAMAKMIVMSAFAFIIMIIMYMVADMRRSVNLVHVVILAIRCDGSSIGSAFKSGKYDADQ